MSRFTQVPVGVWDWAPLVGLEYAGRNLWWGLYTSREAKLLPPGLFHGGPARMAEAAKMGFGDAVTALRELLDKHMVAFDEASRVLRFTQLPVGFDTASSGYVIKSWWTRFQALPAVPVRDAHVPMLRSLCEPFTAKGARSVWDTTFGTLPAPSPRLRIVGEGVGYPLGEGIAEGLAYPLPPQRSLFADSNLASQREGIGEGIREGQYPDQYQYPDHGRGAGEGNPQLHARSGEALEVGAGATLWETAVTELRRSLQPQHFAMWVEGIECVGLHGLELVLRAPNNYVQAFFEHHHLATVLRLLRTLLPDLRIVFWAPVAATGGAS